MPEPKREPFFRILARLRRMPLAEQCGYLIDCVAAEKKDSGRRVELNRLLIDTRRRQIKRELRKVQP
jgi:hypothetical protein